MLISTPARNIVVRLLIFLTEKLAIPPAHKKINIAIKFSFPVNNKPVKKINVKTKFNDIEVSLFIGMDIQILVIPIGIKRLMSIFEECSDVHLKIKCNNIAFAIKKK